MALDLSKNRGSEFGVDGSQGSFGDLGTHEL